MNETMNLQRVFVWSPSYSNSFPPGIAGQRDVLSAFDNSLRGLPEFRALRFGGNSHHPVAAQVPLHPADQEREAEARADHG